MSIDRSSSAGRVGPAFIAVITFFIIVAGLATALAIRWWREPSAPTPSLQLALLPPDELAIGGGVDSQFGLALAPDGRRLAFPAANREGSQIWLRDLTRDDLQALPGTADGVMPFWSPDGGSLGFFAAGKMRVFVFADGSVRDLADAPAPRGAAWHPTGDILFAPRDDGALVRRSPDGRIAPFTTLANGVETSHRYPHIIDGGARLIFFVRSPEPAREGIWIATYPQSAAPRRLVKSDAHGLAVDRTLIYSSGGALVAQGLDDEGGSLSGPSALLGTPVGHGEQNQLLATVGGDVLLYGVAGTGLRELRWVDRHGAPAGHVGEPMDAREVRISPAGASVAVARVGSPLTTLDVWTYEAARPLPRRISPAIDADEAPVWSPDGLRLAWVTGRRSITIREVSGAQPDITLRKFANPVAVSAWPTSASMIVSETRPESRSDILVVPADGAGEPHAYAHSAFNEMQGVVSPDGRWLAYASDESGRFEIYLDTFPTPGRRGRLTVGGGSEPRWNRDGSELFFRRGSEIHVVRPTPGREVPEALSSERLFDTGADIRSFDVTSDGQRFLVNVPAPESAPKPMTVLVNVRSLLPSAR